jgi:CheY-like chemotaxis protein
MQSTIAIVGSKENKALHDWVAKQTSGQVIPSSPAGLKRVLSRHVDLVLVDMKMPEVSGSELLHALRKIRLEPSVPVLLLSPGILEEEERASEFAAMLRRLLQEGPEATSQFVTKPKGVLPKSPDMTGGPPVLAYPRHDWHGVPVKQLAKQMGIPRSTLARILGTAERNLARWIGGRTKPTGIHEINLQRLKYIYALLCRAFKTEVIPRYLREPNSALGGRTPLMLLTTQDFAAVEGNLLQLVEGVYT